MTSTLYPIIEVSIGDRVNKLGKVGKKNSFVFKGDNAPEKAITFLKEKFPECA